jgi:hypothetical protein
MEEFFGGGVEGVRMLGGRRGVVGGGAPVRLVLMIRDGDFCPSNNPDRLSGSLAIR